MSRVGNAVIILPAGTAVTENDGVVHVKGPKGELFQELVKHTRVGINDGVVQVSRDSDSKTSRANHGLMRALINNMVIGVSAGFTRQLEINGIGYRADVKGNMLVLNLGYSHPINFQIPAGITINSDKNNVVSVSGVDKQQVCQVAANIRGYREPDSYKGKGVRYVGEYVRLKTGKSA